jgi:hypothetical protein
MALRALQQDLGCGPRTLAAPRLGLVLRRLQAWSRGMNRTPALAAIYPPFIVDRLVTAATFKDHDEIDRITDELWKLGFVRRRDDQSRFDTVAQFNGQERAPT